MKKISMLFLVLLPLALGAQLPYTPLDTVTMANGRVVPAYIVGERNQRLFFTKADDPDNTVFDVPKSEITSFTRNSYVFSTGFPMEDGEYMIREVVTVEGQAAGAIYSRLRSWLADAYNDSASVLELDDPVGGVMTGHANSMIGLVRMKYDINIECRDGRYRYTFSNLSYKWPDGLELSFNYIYGRGAMLTKGQADLLAASLTHIGQLAASMKAHLLQASTDDW